MFRDPRESSISSPRLAGKASAGGAREKTLVRTEGVSDILSTGNFPVHVPYVRSGVSSSPEAGNTPTIDEHYADNAAGIFPRDGGGGFGFGVENTVPQTYRPRSAVTSNEAEQLEKDAATSSSGASHAKARRGDTVPASVRAGDWVLPCQSSRSSSNQLRTGEGSRWLRVEAVSVG